MDPAVKEKKMKPCPDYRETLLLDVYGELEPHARPAWQRHLKICEACRQEKKQLLGLMQTVKSALPSQVLSRQQAEALAGSVTEKMSHAPEKPGREERFFGKPKRLIPALVTACLLIAALSWVGLKEIKNITNAPMIPDITLEDQMISEDFEVIKNLELLLEMEALEKMVQYLEEPGHGDSSTERESRLSAGEARV